MLSWFLIALIILAILMIMRAKHMRHRFFVIFIILLCLFIYITLNMVSKDNNIKLDNASNIYKAMKVYLGWLGHGFSNLRALAGNAFKMNWTETNGTLVNMSKVK